MTQDHPYGFGTRAIHAGATPDPVTGARKGVLVASDPLVAGRLPTDTAAWVLLAEAP